MSLRGGWCARRAAVAALGAALYAALVLQLLAAAVPGAEAAPAPLTAERTAAAADHAPVDERHRDVRETDNLEDDFIKDFIDAYIMNKVAAASQDGGQDDDDIITPMEKKLSQKRRSRAKMCKINLVACFGRRRRR